MDVGFADASADALRHHSSSAAKPPTDPSPALTHILPIAESQRERDADGRPIFPEAKAEIEDGVHRLETLLTDSAERNLDKLEIYMVRNTLSVPRGLERWVRLGGYEDLYFPPQPATPPSASTSTTKSPPSPATLIHLRRKLHETQKLHSALRAESARNKALLAQLRALLLPPSSSSSTFQTNDHNPNESEPAPDSRLAFLTHSPALLALKQISAPTPSSDENRRRKSTAAPAPTANPLTTQTASLTAQLPALRALLATLREAQARGIQASARSGTQERRAYLEGAVRGAVEGVGGSGGGVNGGVGGAVGKEGVRAIEGIVGGLGGEGGGRGEDG